ncbi:MAG: DUF4431 domain-containing protein [Treponema sp.]|uniref:DUF4431 domain-containing protein n=1 Tax=Treponema sp. TaxID=166 RepID=UPI00298D6A24|nr:DUF4431 domain-containing protein [Treponema sp.]MBR5932894.1 DUF4431 domain-containing protein [Treponema sp.]
MKKLISVLTMIFVFGAVVGLDAVSQKHSGRLIRLSGKLEKKFSYGAPNYGETPEQDAKEYYYVLVFDSDKTVDVDGENVTVKEIQLIFSSTVNTRIQNKKLKLKEGKNYVVKGKLFRAETGHHHTDYVFYVEECFLEK